MHCLVIDVGGIGILGLAAHSLSVVFLLVANVVLRTSNYVRVLNALDSLGHCHTGQDRIGTEAFGLVRNFRCQLKCRNQIPSQFRPPSGTLPIGPATGPSCMSTPFPACSAPIAWPRFFMRRVLHVAATFMPAGKAEFSSAAQPG